MQPNSDLINALQSIALAVQNTSTPENKYKFSAYRNAAFNLVAGTYTKVAFDTEDYDTNGNFASGTYTAPISGYYLFSWSVAINIGSGNSVSALYKNGAIYRWGNEVPSGGGSGGTEQVLLAAGDTVDVYAYITSTPAIGVGTAPRKTSFSGVLLSSS